MMAVDHLGAFFGCGLGGDLGRVRDAAVVSRVACSGSRGVENGDAVRTAPASKSKLSAMSSSVSASAVMR